MNRVRGRRYDDAPRKLNMKKVIATIIAFIVIIMVILSLKRLLTKEEKTQDLEGKTFVVTGKLKTFKNRDELSAAIAARGGKVVGSISGKTDYLINNDTTSGSAKNQSAKRLGIPIISEDEFIALIFSFGHLVTIPD